MQSAEGDYAMYWAWASTEVGPDGASTKGDSGGSHRGQATGMASYGDSSSPLAVSAGGASATVAVSDTGPPFSTPTPASTDPDAYTFAFLVGDATDNGHGPTTGATGLAAGSPGGQPDTYSPVAQGAGTQASAGAFAMPGSGSTAFANAP